MGQARVTLAENLLQAARDIDHLSRRDLQVLLRRAALGIRDAPPQSGYVIVEPEILAILDAILAGNDGNFTRDQAVSSILRDWAIEHGYLRSSEGSDIDDKTQ